MSDQQKEQAPKKRGPKARDGVAPESKLDAAPTPFAGSDPQAPAPEPDPQPAILSASAPTPAAAALARAIEGARPVPETPKADPAPQAALAEAPPTQAVPPSIQIPPRASAPKRAWPRASAQAAAVVLALAAGWVGGSHLSASGSPSVAVPAWAEAASAGIRDSRDDVVRLAGDVRALKVTLEALKEAHDKPRPDAGARQILERLDRSERVAQEASARFIKVAEQLDRIEREPAKAAGAVTERLERIERQVIATANTVAGGAPAAAPAAAKAAAPGPMPVPDPTQTASVPKFDPRQTPVEGWVLLEVYDGAALVEGRNKVHEIAPGQALPGVGKVQAIEKRGKAWIVVTDKGFIGTEVR
jgi:hypothetical protein